MRRFFIFLLPDGKTCSMIVQAHNCIQLCNYAKTKIEEKHRAVSPSSGMKGEEGMGIWGHWVKGRTAGVDRRRDEAISGTEQGGAAGSEGGAAKELC